MAKMISVYLPVEDLEASMQFYLALGCSMIRRGNIDDISIMVWSETITFQLVTRSRFATLTPKTTADTKKFSEMVIMLTVDSRNEVDAVAETAASYGGKADNRTPTDTSGIYSRAFEDPDGHMFNVIWMDVGKAV
ncbi:MAG: VOC family protein [Hyphomicrobiales bacterium]|jgi:predicted lactoylglutathione lyase